MHQREQLIRQPIHQSGSGGLLPKQRARLSCRELPQAALAQWPRRCADRSSTVLGRREGFSHSNLLAKSKMSSQGA